MRRPATIAAVVAQHVDDAAFLFVQRARQVDGRAFGAADLGRIDQRLSGNLAGIEAAGAQAWEVALARFGDFPETGELFVLAWIALGSGESETIDMALTAAVEAPRAEPGISGALARLPPARLRNAVASWLFSADPFLRRLAVCALSHHRVDPGRRLASLLADPEPGPRSRALRLAGELGRADRAGAVIEALADPDAEVRWRAAWSGCLLGANAAAREELEHIAEGESAWHAAAVELRLLAWPRAEAVDWLRGRLARRPEDPVLVAAVGAVGDPAAVPWLIGRMRVPALAHAAGNAFRDLFSVDFDSTDVFAADPATLGPAFAESETPTPVADRAKDWLERRRAGEKTDPFLPMRQARLAALRDALAAPNAPLANWRATRRYPAWR